MRKKDLGTIIDSELVTAVKQGKSKNTKSKHIAFLGISFLLLISIIVSFYFRSLPRLYIDEFPDIELINSKVIEYSGSCKCPAEVDSSGKKCGGRSAWRSAGCLL